MKMHKILKVMVLLLFIGHYSNITLFYHTHTIDGITYCHSHFYGFDTKEQPVPFSHTSSQLQFIQEINQITWNSEISIAAVETPVYPILSIYCFPDVNQVEDRTIVYTSLRAPPSSVA